MTRVFISYSHDGDDHKARVASLAERLRRETDLQVVIDKDELPGGPNVGWPRWSERQVREADRVLAICTATYCQRFDGKQPDGEGLGVVWEALTIEQLLHSQAGVNPKVRAVQFEQDNPEHIPSQLKRYHKFLLYRDYEQLVAWLTGPQAAAKPEDWRAIDVHSGENRVASLPTKANVAGDYRADCCDRQFQEGEAREAIKEHLGRLRPLILVAHGDGEELHESLVRRLSGVTLPSIARAKGLPHRATRLVKVRLLRTNQVDWVRRAIEKSLRDEFDVPREEDEPDAIAYLQKVYDATGLTLVLDLYCRSDQCSGKETEVLRDVCDWSKSIGGQSANVLLLCVLSVAYVAVVKDEPSRRWLGKLAGRLIRPRTVEPVHPMQAALDSFKRCLARDVEVDFEDLSDQSRGSVEPTGCREDTKVVWRLLTGLPKVKGLDVRDWATDHELRHLDDRKIAREIFGNKEYDNNNRIDELESAMRRIHHQLSKQIEKHDSVTSRRNPRHAQ